MSKLHQFKRWAKDSSDPLAQLVRALHRQWRELEITAFAPLYRPLLLVHQGVAQVPNETLRICYWTPLCRCRLAPGPNGKGSNLYLFGGMPLIQGNLTMQLGKGCRISGQTTFSGRWSSQQTPALIIGDNVGISWQTTIAVGSKVVLGDNVRMGGRCFLAGYPGHPLDRVARAKGEPDLDSQVGQITLERDVWLGSGVTVMQGVTIGEGSIVATGSIVTKDLPAGVLAGGVPAKIIRRLEPHLNATQQASQPQEHAA